MGELTLQPCKCSFHKVGGIGELIGRVGLGRYILEWIEFPGKLKSLRMGLMVCLVASWGHVSLQESSEIIGNMQIIRECNQQRAMGWHLLSSSLLCFCCCCCCCCWFALLCWRWNSEPSTCLAHSLLLSHTPSPAPVGFCLWTQRRAGLQGAGSAGEEGLLRVESTSAPSVFPDLTRCPGCIFHRCHLLQ